MASLLTAAESIDFINAYADLHHGGVLKCHHVDGKGRTLWAQKAFEVGDVITKEPLLLKVHVPAQVPQAEGGSAEEHAEAEAYRELERLCREEGAEHEALWYWSALRSLTEAELGEHPHWQPLGEEPQRLLLQLHQGEVRGPSKVVTRIVSHFSLDSCEPSKLERCLQAWFHNAFDATVDRPGNAVYFFPSFMSHSCYPNAVWRVGFSDTHELRAVRGIAPGDELTISYLDEDSMLEDALTRRQLLFKTKRFWCACERCGADYDLSRGMQCPSCLSGSIFARSPCGIDAGQAADPLADQILRPLRPTAYDDVTARDLTQWLTMGVPALKRSSGRFYYEVQLGRGCSEPQIGWATSGFRETAEWNGSGVGDDEHSWGADGVRSRWWHRGQEDCAAGRWRRPWAEGDVVGCSIDLDAGEMAFSENGAWEAAADFAFESEGQSFYPAISTQGEFTLHLDEGAFQFAPVDASFKPLTEWSAKAGPLDRFSPLPGAFAGSVCQSCGFAVGVEESQRLGRLERAVERTMESWDGKELSLEELEEAGEVLKVALTQHVLLDKARDRLAKFHEGHRNFDEQIRILRDRCRFHASVYPGLSCAHAWVLQEYGDALTLSAKADFADVPCSHKPEDYIAKMQLAQTSYSEAHRITSSCFGSETEHCAYLRSKLGSSEEAHKIFATGFGTDSEVCLQVEGKMSCSEKVLEVMRQAEAEPP